MGKQYKEISEEIKQFIEAQKIFFVGTAASEGTVNVSPKGIDSFRVISPTEIAWLNLTGSGNETAAHLLKNNRMTIMFCSFDKSPLILRLYGKASIFHPRDPQYNDLIDLFPENTGSRQVISMKVDLVQTSCGFGVPLMESASERDTLTVWADKKGEEGIEDYWKEKNKESIDGFPTNILPIE